MTEPVTQYQTQLPTIQEAMTAAMEMIGAVAKSERNSHANYHFRGIDAVVNAASPAFRQHGIVVYPYLESVRYDDVKTSNNKLQTACRVVVEYHFVGPAGDEIISRVAGEAWDGGDKATPQAMSVAFRIALLQALALPTDEEVDSREPYERIEPPLMTRDQLTAMQAAFKANGMSGEEGRAARLDLFKDVLKRETNGSDLTMDEAATVIQHLGRGELSPEQQADLSQTLGAKPIESTPEGPRTAAARVGAERRASQDRQDYEAPADHTDGDGRP